VLYLIQGPQPQRKHRAHQRAGPKDPPTETGEQGVGPKLALKRDHYQRSKPASGLSLPFNLRCPVPQELVLSRWS
jgi:hypothetical protein